MAEWDVERALAHQFKPYEIKVTEKDIALYSLSIGFQEDPLNKDHYNFTYENAPNFSAFPTMGVVLAHREAFKDF